MAIAKRSDEFMGNFVRDWAPSRTRTVTIGDQSACTSADEGHGRHLRGTWPPKPRPTRDYVLERVAGWVCAQAAAGYATYDAGAKRFSLSEEKRWRLGRGEPGLPFPARSGAHGDVRTAVPKLVDGSRRVTEVGWHAHHGALCRHRRLFKPGYIANR